MDMRDLVPLRFRPWIQRLRGMTLTELLCVLAIISILAAFYLPAIARAFLRVKRFLSHL